MERKVRDSCGKSASKGDPTGEKAPRRLPDRPRKASAWSGNQRSFYKPSNNRFSDFRNPFCRQTEHLPTIYGFTLNEEVLNGFGTSNLRMCFSFGHPLIKVLLNQHFPINKILVNPFKTHCLFLPFTLYAIWLLPNDLFMVEAPGNTGKCTF